jgi:hypothetical protein
MKKSILLLMTFLLVSLCFGQKSKKLIAQDDVYFMQPAQNGGSKSVLNDSTSISIIHKIKEHKELTAQDDIYYMRKCLSKYYKTRQTGTILGFASVISAGAYVLGEGEKPELLVISGTCGLFSYITYLTAEKWLKRASLKPSDAGFGVKFEF